MKTNLWSIRWSTAKGWHWKLERDALPENAQAWVSVFQKAEPDVIFTVSEKRPNERYMQALLKELGL